MFINPDRPDQEFPRLKGKASELRHFGKPLLEVWNKYKTDGDNTHDSVSLCLAASVRAEEILDEHSTIPALPEEAAEELKDILLQFLCLFAALHREFIDASPSVLYFSVTIKAHMLAHIAHSCYFLNPTVGWCYLGEDFQHLMRILVQSSVRGNTPTQAARKVTGKWNRAVDLEMRGASIWRCRP